jgi:hypothetical protein
MDIQLIKDAYPHPQIAPDNDTGDPQCYCVGGALALFFDIDWLEGKSRRFPCNEDLAEVLALVNPALTEHERLLYARIITRCNDKGDFYYAWRMAEEALVWTPETEVFGG